MLGMRSQTERDRQTVVIATALAIFVAITLTGTLLGLLIDAVSDRVTSANYALTLGTVLLAAGAGLVFLVRHRRS